MSVNEIDETEYAVTGLLCSQSNRGEESTFDRSTRQGLLKGAYVPENEDICEEVPQSFENHPRSITKTSQGACRKQMKNINVSIYFFFSYRVIL